MVIAAENHLIPYAGHHYPLQPYVQDNPIADQQRRQGAVAEKIFFRRPQSEMNAHLNQFNCPGNLYDFTLFVKQPASDRVGLVVDIYA